jgi:hypothetical protein
VRGLLLALALFAASCVGDSSSAPDASADAANESSKADASTTCVFGTGHFGNCNFGP